MNLTPHDLYEFTPNEYSNLLKGYQIKREIELKDKQYQAWFNANFVGAALGGTDLPNIEDIMRLSSDKPKEDPSTSNKNFIESALLRGFKVPQQMIDTVIGARQ